MSVTEITKCPNCGVDRIPGRQFCGSCGYRLDVARTVVAATPSQSTSSGSVAYRSPEPVSVRTIAVGVLTGLWLFWWSWFFLAVIVTLVLLGLGVHR